MLDCNCLLDLAFLYYSSYHCHKDLDCVVGKDLVGAGVAYVDGSEVGFVVEEGNLVLADTVVDTAVEVDSLV